MFSYMLLTVRQAGRWMDKDVRADRQKECFLEGMYLSLQAYTECQADVLWFYTFSLVC